MIIKLGSDRWSRKWKTFLDDIFVYWRANPGQWRIIACGIAFKLLLRPKHSFSMLQLGHISYQSKRKNCWREKNTDVLKNILSMYKHFRPVKIYLKMNNQIIIMICMNIIPIWRLIPMLIYLRTVDSRRNIKNKKIPSKKYL